MRTKELPSWLPAKVTVSLADVVETRRVFQKEKFLKIYDQTDPPDCPLVRALRRAIPEKFWLNIEMYGDYIVHLQTHEGHEFTAALSKADRERLSQYGRHEISPANRTVKLAWEEEFA
jgi:hypothetical protein